MKRRVTSLLLVLACVFSLFCVQQPAQVNAWSDLSLKATATSKTTVKLSWKKTPVSYYRIYRASVNKNGNRGEFKKITTLSKNKNSYTTSVSYKKQYCYEVRGYNKNGKEICSGEDYVYSGISNVVWDEYQWCDAEISPTAIPLEWCCDNGLKPTGYEIHRKENGKSYKKIRTVKNNGTTKGYNKYTDKTVKAKHTYYYKIRAYRTISGKKVYGTYSESVKHSAVNQNGIYYIDVLPGNVVSSSAISGSSVIAPILTSPASICMLVTSDAMNAELRMDSEILWDAEFTFKGKDENGQTKDDFSNVSSYLYTLKGNAWQEVKEEKSVTIKPGETFLIRFDFESADLTDVVSASAITLDTAYGGITYTGFESVTYLTLPKDKAFTVEIDGERYH